MRLWESTATSDQFFKLVLEPQPEGTYVFFFLTRESKFPERDELLDDLEQAFEICEEDYAMPRDAWREIEGPALSRSS